MRCGDSTLTEQLYNVWMRNLDRSFRGWVLMPEGPMTRKLAEWKVTLQVGADAGCGVFGQDYLILADGEEPGGLCGYTG
jgi:hypothetical protein